MLRLITLLCLVGSLYTLTCPCWEWSEEKKKTDCPDVSQCPVGVTLSPCGCCHVCAKDENEPCGGAWFTSGRCGTGLKCSEINDNDYWGTLPQGICVKDESEETEETTR